MAVFRTRVKRTLFTKRTESTDTTDEISEVSDAKNDQQTEPNGGKARRKSFSDEMVPVVKVSKLLSGLAPHNHPVSITLHSRQQNHSSSSIGEEKDVLPSAEKRLLDSQATMEESCSSLDSSQHTGAFLDCSEPDEYGQVHPVETPKLLASKLVSFHNQLVAMPHHKKISLREAMVKCPELLTDKFKLKFLRCECFNEVLAAKRYAKYWDRRVEVFGPDKAFQPLTQSEALRDDALALSMGFLTLTGTKDSAGRNIIYADPSRQDIGAYTTESMARAIWYIFHAALEDEESQKKGVVFLSDLRVTKLSLFDKDLLRIVAASVQGCLPVRLSGIHGCSPPRIFSVIFPVVKLLLGERLRKRVRIHSGSLRRVQSELDKYGLTKAIVPSDLGGEIVLSHKCWLRERSLENK